MEETENEKDFEPEILKQMKRACLKCCKRFDALGKFMRLCKTCRRQGTNSPRVYHVKLKGNV